MSLKDKMTQTLRQKPRDNFSSNFQVAATLLMNGKQIGMIHTNGPSSYSRGHVCASVHAEVSALIAYCGKSISYSVRDGWRQWRFKEAKQC